MKRILAIIFFAALLNFAGLKAQTSLKISELLFNPATGGADWLELYNPADTAVSLADVRLVRWVGDSLGRFYKIDSTVVAPHDYVVITTDAAFVRTAYTVRYPHKVVEISSMPSYNVDRFDYTAAMHSALLRDKEGVSLERRSFELATNNPNNWYSASSTSGYGTPTYANSQSTEFLFRDDEFTLSADIFSPDGDGYEDQLDITYTLSDNTLAANITVFDQTGRAVRHLCRGQLLGAQGVVTWDGLNDSRTRCLPGNYIIAIEAYNTVGRVQTVKRVVALTFR